MRMLKQLELFVGREFVVERHKDAAAKEYCIGGNQPFRLVGHDDRRACAFAKSGVLQCASKGKRCFLELAVGIASVFMVAVRLDQADFFGPRFKGCSQCFAQGFVFAEVQHQRRDWMRSARVRKSVTP